MNTWQQWLEHPIVRRARESLPSSASALDVLTETMRLLHELDDRFPGLPMARILDARDVRPATRKRLRARLLAAGADPADIAALVPTALDLSVSGRSYSDIEEEFGESLANYVNTIQSTPSAREREVAALVIDQGRTTPDVAREIGRNPTWVKKAVDRVLHEQRVAIA